MSSESTFWLLKPFMAVAGGFGVWFNKLSDTKKGLFAAVALIGLGFGASTMLADRWQQPVVNAEEIQAQAAVDTNLQRRVNNLENRTEDLHRLFIGFLCRETGRAPAQCQIEQILERYQFEGERQ